MANVQNVINSQETKNSSVQSNYSYTILIVDDEQKICELLKAVLETRYNVHTSLCTKDALALIDEHQYDLVVTDLKLPDGSGIDILKHAKAKDDHTEIIIITAYASLDTATDAINLGAASYLTKPISVADFSAHVEKQVAHRAFYLKSRMLMSHYQNLNRAAKEHLTNITSIYELSQKLMFSLDIKTIMHTVLNELLIQMNATLAIVGISLNEESEIYVMHRSGEPKIENFRKFIFSQWESLFGAINNKSFSHNKALLFAFPGQDSGTATLPATEPVVIPMIVMGNTIGSIAIYGKNNSQLSVEGYQFLHVFSSLVSPLIDNAYIHRRAKSEAATDSLTGISNHRTFHEILSREIARTDRHQNQFCLAMIDIDDFKKVNDTYGHLVGDAVLKDLALKVNNTIREGDIFARYGGEEFVLILPDTDTDGGLILTERVRRSVSDKPFILYESELAYTISIGLSFYHGKYPQQKRALIQAADDALYESKRLGKNRITVR